MEKTFFKDGLNYGQTGGTLSGVQYFHPQCGPPYFGHSISLIGNIKEHLLCIVVISIICILCQI